MTHSVSTVLRTPSTRPPTITQMMSPSCDRTTTAAANRSSASSGRAILSTVVRRRRAVSIGATHTEVIARPTPQPKNVKPMPSAPKPSGNGV